MKKEIEKVSLEHFNSSYYDIKKDIKINQINVRIGGRGLGKTFSTLNFFIDDYLNNNKKFCVIRRTLAPSFETFYKISQFYPNKFEIEDDKITGISKIYIDENLSGYMLFLSRSSKYKSLNFDVDNILFDEFIKNYGEKRLTKNEFALFFELLETIIRDKINVTCIMLSNAINFNNEYFLNWGITISDLEYNKIFKINEVTNILMLKSDDKYIERKKQTLTYKATKNTTYNDYAYQNSFDTSFLKYYVKQDKSKILPSKTDYYFKFKNRFFIINEKYIKEIELKNIPSKSKIFIRGLTNDSNITQNENLYNDIREKFLIKILSHEMYFNDIDTAITLQEIFFIDIDVGGAFI